MFGRGKSTDALAGVQPSGDDLARLADFAGWSSGDLKRSAARASLEMLNAGGLPARWFDGHRVFLRSGEIELRTANGYRAFLSSVSPPARFPLPSPDKARMRCVEPTTFIRVPDEAARSAAVRGHPDPGLPPQLASLLRLLELKIDSGEIPLPAMPELAVKLSSAVHAPDTLHNDHDIAKLIQLDPVLASKVIHVVNSAAFRFARKAGTVQQAVTRLGRERVRNSAESFLLRHAFHTQSGALRRRAQAVWLRSCHVAAVSFTLARQLPVLEPDRAMLAGLVHLIGALPVLGLANRQPSLFSDRTLLDRAVTALRKPLGRLVLQRWSFDDDLLDALEAAGNWHRVGSALPDYADVVLLAQLHADMGRPVGIRRPPLTQVPAFQKLDLGKLTPSKSIRALEEAEQEIVELRRLLARAG